MLAIARRHEQGAAVVVTHAGVIAQWLGGLAGRNPADWSSSRPGCASITTVAWSKRTAKEHRALLGLARRRHHLQRRRFQHRVGGILVEHSGEFHPVISSIGRGYRAAARVNINPKGESDSTKVPGPWSRR